MPDRRTVEGSVRPFSYPEVTAARTGAEPRSLEQLGHVRMRLASVARAKLTTLRDVATWVEGHIVELDRTPTDPIDLCLNGEMIGRGHIVVDDQELSVRVAEINDRSGEMHHD